MLRSDTQDLCWPRETLCNMTSWNHGETWWNVVKCSVWLGLPPSNDDPDLVRGWVVSLPPSQHKARVTLSLSPPRHPRLQNFINFLSHLNVQCLGDWKISSFYKTLHVHVCTQELRSGFWMDGGSMPNYTLHGCLHGYDLSVTYALQPKLKMLCKSNHRKITSHCHGTRKIMLKQRN